VIARGDGREGLSDCAELPLGPTRCPNEATAEEDMEYAPPAFASGCSVEHCDTGCERSSKAENVAIPDALMMAGEPQETRSEEFAVLTRLAV
jgi:hypothetical protein